MPIRRDKRDSLFKSIALGEKYKLYLANGAVYTKDNKFVKYIDMRVTDYVYGHRRLFSKNKKFRIGHQLIDDLIENPDLLYDQQMDQEIDDVITDILESKKKI